MARLPQVGGDDGAWGEVLNDFLSQAHNNDGSLKNAGLIASKYTKPSAGIPRADLDAGVQASLDKADAATSEAAPDATTTKKGVIRLSGDLAGDALAPLIAPGKVTGGIGGSVALGTLTDDNFHVSANITKSKLAPLALVDADVSVGAAIVQSKIQNLTADLASKASLVHTHDISDITNLQASLDSKAYNVHSHSIANITGLQASLDSKAGSAHTHVAGDIAGFAATTAAVIGDHIQAGSNVTVDFDAGSGITTISATSAGSTGEPSDSVLSVAGRTGNVVLGAGDITSGTFSTNRIPDLDTSKLASGTIGIARIPTGTTDSTVALGNHTHAGLYAPAAHDHSAADIVSGTLNIARIPTGTSSTTIAIGDHTHDSRYAPLLHTHDDRYYTETEVDAALTLKLNSTEKGSTNGLATLGSDGKIPASQLPAIAIKETFTIASQSAMLALAAQRGDLAIRTDNGQTFVLASDNPSALEDWKEITASGSAPVSSVAGKTGSVILDKQDVGLGNIDNTSDTNKPVSAATQSALNNKVDATATFTGAVTTPFIRRTLHAALGTNDSNLQEIFVGSTMRSWINEWGGLRGTSPYNWGDALVRAIRTDGDGISNGDGEAGRGRSIELVDRRTGRAANVMFGVQWKDGRIVQMDQIVGTVFTLEAGQDESDIPSALPDGTLIVRKMS